MKNKVAVVTGSGQGIGEAYAKGLAREGASVVVAELNEEQGRRVTGEIEADGFKALFVKTDVADEASTLAMGKAATEAFGGVDYLVNNAAIYKSMEIHSMLDMPIDYWDRFMRVNMTGALLATRAVYESMTQRGGGSIVNQSSSAAWMAAAARCTGVGSARAWHPICAPSSSASSTCRSHEPALPSASARIARRRSPTSCASCPTAPSWPRTL